jgi:hypothetical protein
MMQNDTSYKKLKSTASDWNDTQIKELDKECSADYCSIEVNSRVGETEGEKCNLLTTTCIIIY